MSGARIWLSALFSIALAVPALAQAQQSAEPDVQPVIDEARVQEIIHRLQGQLDRLGGLAKITHCGPVLDLVTPQMDGFDRSFGASCDIQATDHHLQVLMCDDTRIGKFTLTLAPVPDVDTMRRFIAGNCFPVG
jgi:hypothetical protein